jgi:predicted Zn finger-like uncharacterized protein
MDVKCEQCSAEYDFDESLLGDKGTTVKCSTCGHVFRVMPRRDGARPGLLLRYVRNGQTEQLASLRDLQSLIHAGVVTADDQLGRHGFPWRRLGDVPELRNFFAPRGAGASTPNHNKLRVSPTSMPPADHSGPPSGRGPHAGRTVLGVGAPFPAGSPDPAGPPRSGPQIPGAPRVPTNVSAGPSAPRSNGAQEPPATRAPTSDAPTASRPRPDFSSPPAAARPDLASLSQAPTVPGMPPSEQLRQGAFRTTPAQSAAPPASARPAAQPVPSNPVRLYLSEDEAPPARATEDNSKIWVYAIVLLVLAGGGWLGINALSRKPAPEAPAASRVEVPTPSAAVAPTPTTPGEAAPTAPAPGATAAPTAPATPAPAAEPAPTEAAAEPSPGAEAPSASGSSGSDKSGGGSHGGGGKDPTDYGGWVQKGDKAFQKGDLATARKSYEAALALRGTGSEANTGLGFTLLGEGKAQEAIPHFDRAAGSGYAEANIGLGDAYRRLGQKAAAIEAYKDYLQRLPGGSRVSYVKKQLETLGGADKPAAEAPTPGADDSYRPAGEMGAPEPLPSAPAPAPEGTP